MRNNRTIGKGALPDSNGKLSEKSVQIMRGFANGLEIEQILARDPALCREHIALAAREALVLNGAARSYIERLNKMRERHPRAYDKWTVVEDERVLQMYRNGRTVREIATAVGRHPSAIKNRLQKLGLFD